MKHKASLQQDKTRSAGYTALSLALPHVPEVGAWYTLLSSFPFLALNRHAGLPVLGIEFAEVQETPMNWPGNRGMSWLIYEDSAQAAPIGVPPDGHSEASRRLGRERPVSDTSLTAGKEALLRPMFPSLALMVPALRCASSKDKRARAVSPPARTLSPALLGLLSGARRSTLITEIRPHLGVFYVQDSRHHEKRAAQVDVPGTSELDAFLNGSGDPMRARQKGSVQIGISVQETHAASHRGSLAQRPDASQAMKKGISVQQSPAVLHKASIVQRTAEAQAVNQGISVQDAPVASHKASIVQRTAEAQAVKRDISVQDIPVASQQDLFVQRTADARAAKNGIPMQETTVTSHQGLLVQRTAEAKAAKKGITVQESAVNSQQDSMARRTAESRAANKGTSVQETPVFSHQGSIVQRIAEVLVSSQQRSRATSAYSTRSNVTLKTSQRLSAGVSHSVPPRSNANAASPINNTSTSSKPLVQSAQSNLLRSLLPSLALGPRLEVVKNGADTSSSGGTDAPSLPQPLTQMRRGSEVRVLARLADTIEERVHENVQRIVEKKLEQLSPPVTQAETEKASVSVDTTALVSDDVVQVLMKKMRELADEARFRSGRLR